jgi:hypothetical protein
MDRNDDAAEAPPFCFYEEPMPARQSGIPPCLCELFYFCNASALRSESDATQHFREPGGSQRPEVLRVTRLCDPIQPLVTCQLLATSSK